MTVPAPPPGLAPEDFEAIHEAVLETTRGRWFLAEYGRRVRAQDTERLLAAMRRLEAAVVAPEPGLAERLRGLAAGLRSLGLAEAEALEAEANALSGPARPAPARQIAAPATSLTRRLDALARLDALPVEEKLKLFT